MPVSTPPTVVDECLFFISLVSDFLAVQFSVSSGCARRHSVSTYAAILVLGQIIFNKEAKNINGGASSINDAGKLDYSSSL